MATPRSDWWPLELAVFASVFLHAAMLTAYQYRERLPMTRLWRAVLAAPAGSVTVATNRHRAEPVVRFVMAEPERVEPTEQAPTHRPHIFVETDERQPAAEEPPQDTPFYSDRATLAANPENPTGIEGHLPYVAGTDDRVWSTEDVVAPRPGRVVVTPPSGPGAPRGLQPPEPPTSSAASPSAASPMPKTPAAPVVERGQESISIAEVTRSVEQRRAADQQKREQIREWARLGPSPDAVGHDVGPNILEQPGTVAATPPVASPEGRTLAARKARLVAAGVSRHGVAAFNVAASPFGAYDKRLIQAVQSRWYALIERYGLFERAGQVTVRFELWEDGRVANLERKANTAGEMLALICEKAITDSAPFDPLPESLRILLAGEPREVNFTFYY